MNLFGLFQRNDPIHNRRMRSERLYSYARYLRAYQGFSVRGVLDTNVLRDWKRLKFNFVQPVVNLSAGWLAAKPLDWAVANDPAASREACAIWNRSGSDCALLESALLCSIYGDIVGLATQDAQGKPMIEFVDPSICDPTFDGADYSSISALEIAYEQRSSDGDVETRREMWSARRMEAYLGDRLLETIEYDRLPAVWIRNSSIKGLPYGISDVEPVLELVEEYDHVASKQTRILDYYSAPNVVFSGIQKGAAQAEKSVGTVFYLPSDAKAYFLEWSGHTPDVESQLTRIRNAIAEVSQVPAVAFGNVDAGLNSLSGIAIKILYGPLLNKTHRKQANWRPALERLMWLCLRAAGHEVEQAAVSVHFPNATPIDGQAAVAESSGKIAARLSSRRTEMNNGGIEDPDAELLRIIIEEKMLQLATGGVDLDVDSNRAASLGARGRFVGEQPDEAAAPRAGDVTGTNDDDIAHLIQRYQALAGLADTHAAQAEED
jgi:hypothetical protein